MPRSATVKQYNTFVKGLITEANPLTFPENASIDEDNFVLNRDGSRQRRRGIDFETGYALNTEDTLDFQDKAITRHRWKNVANSGSLDFEVIQIGDTLYFHDLDATVTSTQKSFSVDLTTYKTPTAVSADVGNEPIAGVSGNGKFFVVSKDTEPFYITYNSSTDTISVTQITIQIRDFEGVTDQFAVDTRPTSLPDNKHMYNLHNQGWLDYLLDTGSVGDTIARTFTKKSFYPSNADIWHLAKNSSDQYDPDLLETLGLGNTPAPKGHYILDAFNRNRSTVSPVSGITTQTENNRPEAVAFFAGRVFYGGVESDSTTLNLNGDIYFSPILLDFTKVGQCYQEGDPTSPDFNDLVSTDGGVIPIKEIGKVLKFEVVEDTLVIIADNGVWTISGIDGAFTAGEFVIKKITNIGAVSKSSIVVVEDKIFYWAESGIYALSTSEVSGVLVAQNITETIIQNFYISDIPSDNKVYANGIYDPLSRRIHWLFNDSDSFDSTNFRYKYNRELILDTVLQAYYTNTFGELSSNSPYIVGGFAASKANEVSVRYQLVNDGGEPLVDSAGDYLAETEIINVATATSLQYITASPDSGVPSTTYYTISELNNSDFVDWAEKDGTGVDFTSYLVTGYEILGDMLRKKQAHYLTIHCEKTESGFIAGTGGALTYKTPSGLYFQTRWEWSDSSNSNRWSALTQGYRFNTPYIPDDSDDSFDTGFSIVTTKNKVRGYGKALSIKFQSESGKDVKLLGWGYTITGNTVV